MTYSDIHVAVQSELCLFSSHNTKSQNLSLQNTSIGYGAYDSVNTVHVQCKCNIHNVPVSHLGHCQGTSSFLSLRTSGGTTTHSSGYQILHPSQQTIHLPSSGILHVQWTSTSTQKIVLLVPSLSVLEFQLLGMDAIVEMTSHFALHILLANLIHTCTQVVCHSYCI